MANVWKSEDNLWEWILSFDHVSPRDPTQVVRFGGEHLLPLFLPLSPSSVVSMLKSKAVSFSFFAFDFGDRISWSPSLS